MTKQQAEAEVDEIIRDFHRWEARRWLEEVTGHFSEDDIAKVMRDLNVKAVTEEAIQDVVQDISKKKN